MKTVLAARAFAALMLAGASVAAFAQSEANQSWPAPVVITNATLVPVDDFAPGPASVTADPAIYRRYSSDALLDGDPAHPQLGSAISFNVAGPQVRISGLHVYVYSTAAVVQQRVQAVVQFWDKYQVTAPDKPVFATAPPMSQIVLDLIGPFGLEVNKAYRIDAVLPKPLLLGGYQNRGVAVQVLATTGFGDPELQTNLLPAYDKGSAPPMGSLVASYANDGTQAFNFRGDERIVDVPADHSRLDRWLAIQFDGTPHKLTQCTGWTAGFRNQYLEEFDTQISPRWRFDLNGGDATPDFAMGGGLPVLGSGSGIPYLRIPNPASPTIPIPPSGEFSVRWLAQYLNQGASGDGLVVGNGTPALNAAPTNAQQLVRMWQDTSAGLTASVVTNMNPLATFSFCLNGGCSAEPNVVHDFEFCWLSNSVELWVDGTRRINQLRDASVPRPDSVWIGNPATGFGGWNDLTVFRLHVRKQNPADTIFYDSFQ